MIRLFAYTYMHREIFELIARIEEQVLFQNYFEIQFKMSISYITI